MIKIAIIDPHPIVRCGFQNFFSDFDQIDVVNTSACLSQSIKYLESNPVDILISEMVLSDETPTNLINRIKEVNPEINIVFFTDEDQEIYSIPLLKAGALGFFSKNVDASVMADAIHKINCYKLYITNNFNNELSLDLDLEKPRNDYGTLSSREIEVLKFLTEGKRNIEIAECLKINQKTVNTYKNRMMHKLKVNNLFDLYVQAKNLNLV
jgi:DNA-binding NarL/FixJ family response regulator